MDENTKIKILELLLEMQVKRNEFLTQYLQNTINIINIIDNMQSKNILKI